VLQAGRSRVRFPMLYNCNSFFTCFTSHQVFICTHMISVFRLSLFLYYPRCNKLAVRTRKCRVLQLHFLDVAQTPARITDITLSRITLALATIFCPGIGTRLRQKDQKGRKGQEIWVHIYPTVSSRPMGRCLQSMVQISSEIRICIRYKQTNKQTNFQLYI